MVNKDLMGILKFNLQTYSKISITFLYFKVSKALSFPETLEKWKYGLQEEILKYHSLFL